MAKRNAAVKSNPKAARYTEPGCACCPPAVRARQQGEEEECGPGDCPSKAEAA